MGHDAGGTLSDHAIQFVGYSVFVTVSTPSLLRLTFMGAPKRANGEPEPYSSVMRLTYFRVSAYGGTPRLRSTARSPALYAASVRGRSPEKFCSNAFRWRTPASTFCCGSKGSLTFSDFAVLGISCIRPSAPLRETACGLKSDSTFTMARTRLGST